MDAARLSIYRFGRFSAVSFSLMLPLLGAAIAARDVSLPLLGGLVIVAVAFHLFAYVSNDVADLRVDRTEPLRSDSPLVRGLVRPSTALAIAFAQIPIAFAVLTSIAEDRVGASIAMAVAMGCMGVYNLYGKRLTFPLLTDAIQSAGWVALALTGTLATGASPDGATLAFAALVFMYVLLVNGVHGGLRDLGNDRRCGARTTAIYFGARVAADGALVVPPSLVIYAFTLQTVIAVISVAAVTYRIDATRSATAWTPLLSILILQIVLLWLLWYTLATARRRAGMIRAGIIHLLVSLAALIVPFAWLMDVAMIGTVVAAYALPVAGMCLHDGINWETS